MQSARKACSSRPERTRAQWRSAERLGRWTLHPALLPRGCCATLTAQQFGHTWRRRFRGCAGTRRLITSRLQVSNDNAVRHKIEHSSVVYGRACRRTRDRFEVQNLFRL